MDEKLVGKLKKSGLTELEAKVYLTVLISGGMYPSKIAEETGINRTTVYNILSVLDVRGLVRGIEKGKKLFYSAEKPDHLLRAANYQKQIAEDNLSRAKDLLPELEGLFTGANNKPRVSFYEGYERVVEAYLTHVDVKKGYEMRCFANPADVASFFGRERFRKQYVLPKERLGITVRFLAPGGEYTPKFSKEMFTGIKKNIWPQFRIMPESTFSFPAEITLYDHNKVSIVKFDKENPVAIIITDQVIYDTIGMIFEAIWKNAKPLSN